jgi:hypothetical protein
MIKTIEKYFFVTGVFPLFRIAIDNKKSTEFKDYFTFEKKYTKKQFYSWFLNREEWIDELEKLK